MLRHRRHQQLEGEELRDDQEEVHGDVLEVRGGQRAIEDGREAEDQLIGQELVVLDEKVQSMAASMMGTDLEGRASRPRAGADEGALMVMDSQLRTPQRPREIKISTPETVKSEPIPEPRGRPMSFAPLPPLFDDHQLQQFQEMYASAPSLYPTVSRQEEMRPDFLKEDEMRLQRLKLEEERLRESRRLASVRHEEQAVIWKMYQEAREENEILRKRIDLLTEEVATYERMFDEAQFGTPDGSREKDIGVSEEKRPADGHRSGIKGASRPSEPGGQYATKDPRSKGLEQGGDDGSQKATLQVMLGLMQGMQELQKRVLEVEKGEEKGEAEWVRGGSVVLPKLPEWSGTTGPIDFNDWLCLIEPQMADLTNTSAEWWSQLLEESRDWYEEHLKLPPLKRMGHEARPSLALSVKRWSRLERRASTLLLAALPDGQRDDLVAAKRLTSLEIICHLLMTYQPGGLAEKELILKSLEQPTESTSLQEAIVNRRRWARWRRRAADLGVSEPDPYLLLKGLNRIIKRPLELHKDLSFRISLARSTLQVDATPTAASITEFALHLQAELEQVVHPYSYARGVQERDGRQGATSR